MTIERLEELHTLTGEMCKEMIDAKRWTVTAPDYAFDIRSLISSEIERQYNNTDQLPCQWTYDEDHDAYQTSCGELVVCETGTEGIKYCSQCGGKVDDRSE